MPSLLNRLDGDQLRLAVVCAYATALLIGPEAFGASWWISSRDDMQWTNRSVAEIRAEAERGNAAAQFHYARAFYFGTEPDPGLTNSLSWTRRAAGQGHAEAQFMAARFYFSGTATPRNPSEGLAWATRAAAKGHADAIALVADANAFGSGTNRNTAAALQLYNEAIDKGSVIALDWLGHFYLNGEGGSAERTNYVQALRCFERAASNEMAHAAVHILEMCEKGLGTPPDRKRGLHWARYFADQNDPEMMEKLASIYSSGDAEPRGAHETATELLRRAAEKRVAPLQAGARQARSTVNLRPLGNDINALAERYFFGLGTARDYVASARWLWQATQLSGRPPASASGEQRTESPHVFDAIVAGKISATSTEKRRLHQAADLVHRGLSQNSPDAVRTIGEMYRDGSELTPQHPVNAWLWLNRAAELGNGPAKIALAEVEKSLSSEHLASAKARFLPKVANNL